MDALDEKKINDAITVLANNKKLMGVLINCKYRYLDKANRDELSAYLKPIKKVGISPFKLLGIFNFGILVKKNNIGIIVKLTALKVSFEGFIWPEGCHPLTAVAKIMNLYKFAKK